RARSRTASSPRPLHDALPISKPFEMAELNARVRALGRRRGARLHNVEALGMLTYDRLSRQLSGPDGLIILPRRELALWEMLLEQDRKSTRLNSSHVTISHADF